MAQQQEEEKKQSSPIDTATDAVRMGMKMKGKGVMVKAGTQLAARAAAIMGPAIVSAGPILLIVLGIIVIFVIIVIIILVAIGVIGGGGSAHAFGSGLGVKENYCQAYESPQDLNGAEPGNGCSIELLNILNAAAGAARMPTAVLVAIGLTENISDVMLISEQEIIDYSLEGAVLPDGGATNTVGKCATSGADARGPMQFLPDTFEGHKAFVTDTLGRRDPQICNIKDNIYAAAHKLKSDSGIIFEEPARAWTEDEIVLAASLYHWGRQRTLEECNTSFNYCKRVLDFYDDKKDTGVGVTDLVAAPCGWPTTGTITTLFGVRTGVQRQHSGLDIAPNTPVGVNDGQMVFNIMTGTITFSQWNDIGGGMIKVDSTVGRTEYRVAYLHMSRSAVDTMALRSSGSINRGEAIGRTYSAITEDHFNGDGVASPGELPHSGGTHLHYEIYENDSLVDPQNFTPERLDNLGVIDSTGGCEDTGTAAINDLVNFEGGWSDPEKAFITAALATPLRSNTWRGLVFGSGRVTLKKGSGDPECPTTCSAYVDTANSVVLHPAFFGRSADQKILVMTHELGHVMQLRNTDNIFSRFLNSPAKAEFDTKGVIRSYPLCSGHTCPGFTVTPVNEDFAEMIGAYVKSRAGGDMTIEQYRTEYPAHYQFAKDEIFGGITF